MNNSKYLSDPDIRQAFRQKYDKMAVPQITENFMAHVIERMRHKEKMAVRLRLAKITSYGIAASIVMAFALWTFLDSSPDIEVKPTTQTAELIVTKTNLDADMPVKQTESVIVTPIKSHKKNNSIRKKQRADVSAKVETKPQQQTTDAYQQETRDMLCARFDRGDEQIAELRAELVR